MINWRALCLTMLVSVAPCALCTRAQSPKTFCWIDQKQSGALWNTVEHAFHDELKASLSDYGNTYGYLKRVGVFGNAALVIVARRMVNYPRGGDQYSSAFNYDIATKSISGIAGLDYMWYWKFFKLARFEPSLAPDVVFSYDDCTGCEADEILAALYYDPSLGKWKLRPWKTGGPTDSTIATGLVVHADSEPDDQAISNDSLYGLVDLSGNGVYEVALRVREVTEPAKGKRQVDDWTAVYGMSHGQFSGRSVTNKQEQIRVWSKLCAKSTNKLCKDVSTRQ